MSSSYRTQAVTRPKGRGLTPMCTYYLTEGMDEPELPWRRVDVWEIPILIAQVRPWLWWPAGGLHTVRGACPQTTVVCTLFISGLETLEVFHALHGRTPFAFIIHLG